MPFADGFSWKGRGGVGQDEFQKMSGCWEIHELISYFRGKSIVSRLPFPPVK